MPELAKNLLPGLKDDQKSELLREVFEVVNHEMREFNGAWTESENAYRYLAGEQKLPKEKEWFTTQDRPQYAYNLVFPRFNQVMGDFLLTNIKRKVYPAPGADGKMAEIFQKLLDNIYHQKEIKWELINTALAGVCKMGYAYPCIDNEFDIEGDVSVKNISEFKVVFDSRAEHPLLDDAAYVARLGFGDVIDIPNMWPEHRSKLKELLDIREDNDNYRAWIERLQPREQKWVLHHDVYDKREGKYMIIEYHRFEWKPTTIFTDLMTGVSEPWIEDIDQRKKDTFLRLHPNHKFSERVAKIKVVTTVIPGLNFVAEHYEPVLQDGTYDILKYSFYPYSKHALGNFGIFRNMQDAQDAFNEDENEKRHILRWHASSGYMYRPEMLHNPQDVELYSTRPNQNYAINSSAPNVSLDQIMKRNEPSGNPDAIMRMAQDSSELIDRVSGFSSNFLFGQTQTSNENASLFAGRVQQTQQTFQIGYSAWARFNQRLDNKVLKLIKMVYTTERVVMITIPGSADPETLLLNFQYLNQKINDVSQGSFRSIVDEQNQTPTMRLLRFRLKSELINLITNLIGPSAVGVIPWEWYLRDSVDLGDVEPLIANLQAFTQQSGAQGEEEEAIQRIYQLLDGAKQQLELQKLAGENVSRQSGEEERINSNQGAFA